MPYPNTVNEEVSFFIKSRDKMVNVYEAFLKELTTANSQEQIEEVFMKYQSMFAVNSSDNTYREFCILKDNYHEENISVLISAIRKELKIGKKTAQKAN